MAGRPQILRGGTVVDPVDGPVRADLEIAGGVVGRVGAELDGDAEIVDVGGRLLLPGSIDTHSHADARVLDADVQHALLRQGVTSIIAGQDGVSFAPGDGGYATRYFGPLNGAHPDYSGGVDGLLAGYAGTTRVNVGYLIPAGTVRHEVMGSTPGEASAGQLAAMAQLVRDGLRSGALGLSSGLDYVPGGYADAAELAALCAPVAEVGGVYVTHMRGYEESAARAMEEVEAICARSGVAAHVSHFHAAPGIVRDSLERAAAGGHDVTFDAYPYFRGFTLMSMALLPKDLVALGNERAATILGEPEARERLSGSWHAGRLASGQADPDWAQRMTIASAGSAEFAWAEGLTVLAGADRAGLPDVEFAYRMLAASTLTSTATMEVREQRDDDALAVQFALKGAMCGSDGIYLGAVPHPRAWGCFARMYGRFVRQRGDFSWQQMAMILSGRPASRFHLARRGRLVRGAVADVIALDPETVADTATYDQPRSLATGIDDVWVNGARVLAGGELTDVLSGMALERSHGG